MTMPTYASIPAGSRIVTTIPIAGDGPAIVAANAVWVVDRAGGAANPDGTPKARSFASTRRRME
jgi:hypothetical protein